MSQFRRPALLVVCLVLLTVVPMTAQTAPAVASEVHHDSSASLRSMVAATSHLKPAITRGEHAEFEGYVKPIYNQSMQDSAVQTSAGAPVGTTAGLSFAGIGQGDYNYNVTFPAPDSNGAVGATQYVHSVASSFAVFDKSTGALLLGPANINSLFAGFGGPCEPAQAGDSVVVYDRVADRWVVGTMAQRLPTGEGFSYSCIAVSQTSDATGAFNRYSIKMSSIDYQKIGVWPDAYYVGLNNPQNTTSTACALDRTSMLQGGSARPICFNAPGYNTLLPSDLDGRTLPPAGSPNYFVGGINAAPNVLNLFKFHVDFT